ncbi:hypothetical protein AB205_0034000 [Aquarana catesbeiana]|uniref:Uncharacterized protein n=1 Tax=Aquarana catesbeiana TaxID=8400 RepID=A0A2G9SH09_AQUCT|nr:hypothetical protein AB205_0034000 [Aquarana catesbeiana]
MNCLPSLKCLTAGVKRKVIQMITACHSSQEMCPLSHIVAFNHSALGFIARESYNPCQIFFFFHLCPVQRLSFTSFPIAIQEVRGNTGKLRESLGDPQQAPFAASSFSSVPYCAQPAKGVFNVPEDSSHPQGISLSVSNCFLSRHGSFPVPSVLEDCPAIEAAQRWIVGQYKSVFRSYSQDFAPHSQAPALPLLSPAIFYSSRYPLPDSVPPPPVVAPASLCPPLASSQGGSACGTPPACLPFELPFSGSLQTSAVRTGGGSAGRV